MISNNSKQQNNDLETSPSTLQSDNTAMLAGHRVNRIGFGAMQLPGPGVMGPPRDRKTALTVLQRAMDLGVNHIDTAQFYGPDVANELIKEALYPYPEDLVLVSKIGAERNAKGDWLPAQRPEQLRASVEENLRSLYVEQLQAVNLRIMDIPHDGSPFPADQQVNLDDQLAEMIALRDEGKIGGIGMSNVNLQQLRQALPADIVCVQNAYNLLYREDEPLLNLCLKNQIAWVPFFPLGSSGIPGMQQVTKDAQVIAAATKLSVTPAQVGLAWLLAHAPNILLIPGTSNPEHLTENIAVGKVRLDEKTMDSLNEQVEAGNNKEK